MASFSPIAGLVEAVGFDDGVVLADASVAGVEHDRVLLAVVGVECTGVVHGDLVTVCGLRCVFSQVVLVDVDSDHRYGGQDEYYEADRENRVNTTKQTVKIGSLFFFSSPVILPPVRLKTYYKSIRTSCFT